MTSASTLLNPALAFAAGPATFGPVVDAVQDTTAHDTFLLETSTALNDTLSVFVGLVGHPYAKRFGFQDDLTRLRSAREATEEGQALLFLKGALVAMRGNLGKIWEIPNGRLVCGAALALLQDEIHVTEEGAVQFFRFPRVQPVELPDRVSLGDHDVENLKNPGDDLKTSIPHNLSLEDYREALEIQSPKDAIPIFTDLEQVPARRILALKYWFFSLDGDIQMQAETANALFDIVTQEEWNEFQEFVVKLLNNLLSGEFKPWMELYLKKLFAHLSHFDPVRMTKPEMEKTKVLINQLGGILYCHVVTFQRQQPSSLEFDFTLTWLLAISDPDMHWPNAIREEGFYLWSFIIEDHFKKGRATVHKAIKKLAKNERDLDFLYNVVDRHIWRGRPLPMQMVREIIDIICRRDDVDEERERQFRTLVKEDADDALVEKTGNVWNWLCRLFRI